jgi:hypothetical protein
MKIYYFFQTGYVLAFNQFKCWRKKKTTQHLILVKTQNILFTLKK